MRSYLRKRVRSMSVISLHKAADALYALAFLVIVGGWTLTMTTNSWWFAACSAIGVIGLCIAGLTLDGYVGQRITLSDHLGRRTN